MTEFRDMYGVVYIFDNSKAQRVKVGMTCNSISNVETRLRDANAKWLERSVTCQVCGGRRLANWDGSVPKHSINGKPCSGANTSPLEVDVTLAEARLEAYKNSLSGLSGSEKGSVSRLANNLEKRIEKYRHHKKPVGIWRMNTAFYTDCAEQVELRSHKLLEDYLDNQAPFGEVFCCSVPVAIEAVETALSQMGLLDSAKKEFI